MSVFELIENNKIKEIKALLDNDPDLVNVRGAYGQTSLHIAARMGLIEICELLIRTGADVSAKNKDGLTVLALTPRRYKGIVKLLKKHGGC